MKVAVTKHNHGNTKKKPAMRESGGRIIVGRLPHKQATRLGVLAFLCRRWTEYPEARGIKREASREDWRWENNSRRAVFAQFLAICRSMSRIPAQ